MIKPLGPHRSRRTTAPCRVSFRASPPQCCRLNRSLSRGGIGCIPAAGCRPHPRQPARHRCWSSSAHENRGRVPETTKMSTTSDVQARQCGSRSQALGISPAKPESAAWRSTRALYRAFRFFLIRNSRPTCDSSCTGVIEPLEDANRGNRRSWTTEISFRKLLCTVQAHRPRG